MKNKVLTILIITLILTFSQAIVFSEVTEVMSEDIDVEKIIKEFEDFGFTVPKVNVVYVNSFYGRPDVQAVYFEGTITVKRGDLAMRAVRHEIAHSVSLSIIDENELGFKEYKINRMGNCKVRTVFYNLTANQLNYVFRMLKWFYNITNVDEIVAEDICYIIYGTDTLQKQYIQNPTVDEIEMLKKLLFEN